MGLVNPFRYLNVSSFKSIKHTDSSRESMRQQKPQTQNCEEEKRQGIGNGSRSRALRTKTVETQIGELSHKPRSQQGESHRGEWLSGYQCGQGPPLDSRVTIGTGVANVLVQIFTISYFGQSKGHLSHSLLPSILCSWNLPSTQFLNSSDYGSVCPCHISYIYMVSHCPQCEIQGLCGPDSLQCASNFGECSNLLQKMMKMILILLVGGAQESTGGFSFKKLLYFLCK